MYVSEIPGWSKTRISLCVNDQVKIRTIPYTLAKTCACVNVDTSLTSLKQWSSSLCAAILFPLLVGDMSYTQVRTCVRTYVRTCKHIHPAELHAWII